MKKLIIILAACLLVGCGGEETIEPVEEKVIELDTEAYHKTKLKTYNNTLPHIINDYIEMYDNQYGNYIIEMYDTNYEPVWQFTWRDLDINDGPFKEVPIIEDNVVVVNVQGKISVLDLATGTFKWEIETDINSISHIENDYLYVVGYKDDFITGFSLETGEALLVVPDDDYIQVDAVTLVADQIIAYSRKNTSHINAVTFDLEGQYVKKQTYKEITPKAIVWDEVTTSDESEEGFYVVDGNYKTAWQESVKGYGEKEWIEITKVIPVNVRELVIINGDQSSEKAYTENAKLKTITLSVGDGKSFTYKFSTFEYGHKDRIRFVKPVVADYMLLNIIEAEPGEMFKNTCISEIVTE